MNSNKHIVMLFLALAATLLSCWDKDKDLPSLSVSPTELSLLGESGSNVTFNINTNKEWSISEPPEWLHLSASKGEGNATVTATSLEPNTSDKDRTALLTVKVEGLTKDVSITQVALSAKDTRVYISNQIVLSDGFYADLTFDKNVLGYVEGFYHADALDTKTLDEIYEEVKDGEHYSASHYDYTIVELPEANTEYVYCVIGYSGSGTVKQYGPMEVYSFKSRSSSNYCDAIVGSISYNSSKWSYTISKQQRCHHYWKVSETGSNADLLYSFPNVLLAKLIRDMQNESEVSGFDYYLNDGTVSEPRNASEESLFVYTWGVDDNNEYSGNISYSYKNTNYYAYPSTKDSIKNISTWHKVTRSEIDRAFSNIKVEYVE